MLTLNEYLNKTWGEYLEGGQDIYSEGLFLNAIRQRYTTSLTWLDEATAVSIDIEWAKGRSNMKKLSPLVARMEIEDEDPMGDLESSNLVKVIAKRFIHKWEKIHAVLFADYNPIENYNMTEDENTGTDMKTHTYEGDGAGNETESSLYGFNSETPVPSDKSSVKSAMQTEGDFQANHRKLTRSGNIGVTLTQRMMQAELDIRKNQMAEIIMSDLDSLLCQRAY